MPADNGSLTLIATHSAMPEIVFKGKEYVYNHHLTVPYRPLVVDAAKGIGPGDLNSNLVIHGDNLHALKALLPRYAGRVDLVFIDPPYNTGNEGWCYSDGVNSPIMKEWLSTNPVDGDDMLRHDKWLCMMWPRLVLLRELMSETAASGSRWTTTRCTGRGWCWMRFLGQTVFWGSLRGKRFTAHAWMQPVSARTLTWCWCMQSPKMPRIWCHLLKSRTSGSSLTLSRKRAEKPVCAA
jgi:hypothetical protein